ncbi:MAG TPA: diacylglycerol kinase family protein [Caulobacteraceae bacterium]|jgi:diacylglycerol kinase family enzyme
MTSSTLTAAPTQPDVRPRLRRIQAVVNAASGSVGPEAAATLSALVAEHGYDLTVATPEPDEIEDAVRAAVGAAPDLVLVLAGDGTARLAAELCGPDGPLVAPLPGGTMNMLPRALYGNRPWPDALTSALEDGVERSICGGRVGQRAFYVAAILGSPALWGHAREAVRARKFQEAWRRAGYALRRAFTGELRYALDGGRRQEAEAMILINPVVSKSMEQETALEAAVLDMRDAREVFRLAFNGLVSDWRRDPGVTVTPCTQGRIWARRSIPAILDGEVQRLPRMAQIEFVPHAFRALAPPPGQDPPSGEKPSL